MFTARFNRYRGVVCAAVGFTVNPAGEPMIWGVDHALPLLYELGFRHVQEDTFDEACLTHTGTYDRARKFRFQHLVQARVARD